MTITDTTTKTAEVSITVTVDGQTKTFTGSAHTDGNVGNATVGAIQAAHHDACNWVREQVTVPALQRSRR